MIQHFEHFIPLDVDRTFPGIHRRDQDTLQWNREERLLPFIHAIVRLIEPHANYIPIGGSAPESGNQSKLDIVLLHQYGRKPMFVVTPEGWFDHQIRLDKEHSQPGHIVLNVDTGMSEDADPFHCPYYVLDQSNVQYDRYETYGYTMTLTNNPERTGDNTVIVGTRLLPVEPGGEFRTPDTCIRGGYAVFFVGFEPIEVHGLPGAETVTTTISGFVGDNATPEWHH